MYVTAYISLERSMFVTLDICCTMRHKQRESKECRDMTWHAFSLFTAFRLTRCTCTDSIMTIQPPHKQDENAGLREGCHPPGHLCAEPLRRTEAQKRNKPLCSSSHRSLITGNDSGEKTIQVLHLSITTSLSRSRFNSSAKVKEYRQKFSCNFTN